MYCKWEKTHFANKYPSPLSVGRKIKEIKKLKYRESG